MANNKKTGWLVPVVLVGIAALAIGTARFQDNINLDVNLTWDDYSSLFTNLFLIAVLVERFIEIFLGVARAPEKQSIQRDIEFADSDGAKQVAERKLDKFSGETRRQAMQLAFTMGILVALAGVRTIGMVFDAVELTSMQAFLFRLIDVLLTAGLITGGSSGVNKVTALFGAHLETRAQQAKKIDSAGT